MSRIETQAHPTVDDYVDEYPSDDIIEPKEYHFVGPSVHSKPIKLTKLETLETKAHALKDALVRDWVDLAETISAIIDTDLWRQSSYTNRRDYCEHQLGWSYEWCRRIINGAVAVQQTAQLNEAPSNAVATELGRLPEPERAKAIEVLQANDQPLTAERVRVYREISSEGLPATPAKIIEFTDRHIEIRISAEAKRHSKPAEMLRRLADGLDADEIGG